VPRVIARLGSTRSIRWHEEERETRNAGTKIRREKSRALPTYRFIGHAPIAAEVMPLTFAANVRSPPLPAGS
jgi:hypothetical protein